MKHNVPGTADHKPDVDSKLLPSVAKTARMKLSPKLVLPPAQLEPHRPA